MHTNHWDESNRVLALLLFAPFLCDRIFHTQLSDSALWWAVAFVSWVFGAAAVWKLCRALFQCKAKKRSQPWASHTS